MTRRDNQKTIAHDDEQDVYPEGSYFTYRPLSSLPTPPPSSRDSISSHSPTNSLTDGESLNPKLRGPAIHLVNLIPASASLATASVPVVQAMLSRADLDLETIALAVCILDSLGAKFARTWRLSCPLQAPAAANNAPTTPDTPPTSLSPSHVIPAAAIKRHSLPPDPLSDHCRREYQKRLMHIDSVGPEVIVLAALVIAAKFVEDFHRPAAVYCSSWGRDRWTGDQLNTTERCIMESLGYRIMPLCDEACLADAMVDMQLAAQHSGYANAHDHACDQRRLQPAGLASPPLSAGPQGATFSMSHSRSKTMAVVMNPSMLE
ncbi:hypothetical protein GMORB2_0582 [Geosmithia morbida]|uniref:Cyclin N-terminal domain-containing protein n=1 Tax=Geosmithia morbida TaxID=1094350 RepID=A0A9P5D8J2_9HYPO|nr:uncharacterized protein GMORB2_0582 [Geosmithia morbida]KAF4126845.1 hypothetical protein GMORB2_0582 [Geosmithia morbida]